MGQASCNLIFVSLVQNQQILIFSHDLSSNIFSKSSASKIRRPKKMAPAGQLSMPKPELQLPNPDKPEK